MTTRTSWVSGRCISPLSKATGVLLAGCWPSQWTWTRWPPAGEDRATARPSSMPSWPARSSLPSSWSALAPSLTRFVPCSPQDIPSLETSARGLARKEHLELELSPAPRRTPSTERVAPVKTASKESLADSFQSLAVSPGQNAEYEEELGVRIGDQCMVEARNFHGVAIIRYVGPCNKRTGLWIGLELPEPVGRNDGKLEARRYFTCLPNCGLFVRSEKITKLTS